MPLGSFNFNNLIQKQMENQKPISNAPMILGIIGGILGLPAAICSGACAAGLSTLADGATEQSSSDAGGVFLWIGLMSAFLGLISSFLYKSNPKGWGAMMVIAGILAGITLVTFNFLSFVVTILFLIGGVISLTQKKQVAIP
jgi:phage shock protein PspC (stress-responsive transcriptional regulator)